MAGLAPRKNAPAPQKIAVLVLDLSQVMAIARRAQEFDDAGDPGKVV